MNDLTMEDVTTFLIFLLRTRRADVDAIPAAAALAPTLDTTLGEVEALPPESFGEKPNAEELKTVDDHHDGIGLALFYLALAYRACPTASAEAKQAAKLILDRYVPSRGHLRATYATEAARAKSRQAPLAADKPTLDHLPVEGGTAHDWATTYVEDGLKLDALLFGRADQTGTRTPASRLRVQAIGEVGTLRDTIAQALRRTPDGGRAVDKWLFGYLDLLADMRGRGSKEPTPPPPPVPNPAG